MVELATVTKRTWTSNSQPREAWQLAFTDAAGKRHKQLFPTKRAADARRVEVEGQVATGSFRAAATRATVADACTEYLKHLDARHDRDARVTTTYLHTVRGEIWNYIAPALKPDSHDKIGSRVTPFADGVGHMRLGQMAPSAVGEFRDRLLAAGVSVSTSRRVLATLSRVLAHAVTMDLVAVNSAKGVKVIGSRDQGPKKIVPPSRATMKALLKAASPDFKLAIQFAAISGLRASEQWALKWGDLDLEAGTVSVTTRVDIHGKEGRTKSEAGTRTVPIGASMSTALKKAKPTGATRTDLVFPGSTGSHLRHGNMIKRTFGPLARSINEVGLTWHGLRHYAVSTWIEAGLQPKVVQTFAGHANIAITYDRYGHLFPSEDHGKLVEKATAGLFG